MQFYKVAFEVGVPANNWTDAVEAAQQAVAAIPQMFVVGAEVIAAGDPIAKMADEVVALFGATYSERIPAVKELRTRAKVGLKEANDAIVAAIDRRGPVAC